MFVRSLFSIMFVLFTLVSVFGNAKPLDVSKIMSAEKLSKSQIGTKVIVAGSILSVKESKGEDDPLLLHVATNSDGIKVLIGYTPKQFNLLHHDLEVPEKGTTVMTQGKLWEYEGNLLVVPQSLEDIIIQGGTQAKKSSASSTPRNSSRPSQSRRSSSVYTMKDYPKFITMQGQTITFTGKVDEYIEAWSDTAPSILVVMQGDKKFEIVFWDRENLLDYKLKRAGAEFSVTGKIQDHRGRIQLKVSDNDTMKLIKSR